MKRAVFPHTVDSTPMYYAKSYFTPYIWRVSVAFVANGELLLLTGSMQMARWKVGEAHFSVSAVDRKSYSLHPPLIVGTEVYIANRNGPKVEKWSLELSRFL